MLDQAAPAAKKLDGLKEVGGWSCEDEWNRDKILILPSPSSYSSVTFAFHRLNDGWTRMTWQSLDSSPLKMDLPSRLILMLLRCSERFVFYLSTHSICRLSELMSIEWFDWSLISFRSSRRWVGRLTLQPSRSTMLSPMTSSSSIPLSSSPNSSPRAELTTRYHFFIIIFSWGIFRSILVPYFEFAGRRDSWRSDCLLPWSFCSSRWKDDQGKCCQ